MMRGGGGGGGQGASAPVVAAHHQSTSSIYFSDQPPNANQHHSIHNQRSNDNLDANSLQSERLGRRGAIKVNQFLFPAFLIECAILACLAAFAYYLRFTSEFEGHHRVIPCIDYTLAYPYHSGSGANNSSVVVYVDHTTLYCVSFLLPVGLILLSEFILWLFSPPERKVVSTFTSSFRIPLIVRRILRFVGTFWMGALIISILTDSMKLLSGRPRPYFLTVCNAECSLAAPFVTANDCRPSSDHQVDLRDAQLSFPSYFATLSSFAAVFSICYTQVMANVHGNYFLRPVLFGALAGMSLLAGFTRWTLYASHWEDLLFGYVVGSAFAVYISFGILNCFRENKVSGADGVINQTPLQGANSWFSWFAIPRITATTHRSTAAKSGTEHFAPPTNIYMNGNASDTNSSSVGPNPAFQQEIHRRVEDFGRKNQHAGSGSRVDDQQY